MYLPKEQLPSGKSFDRGQLHGIANGATSASAAIVTEFERQMSIQKRAERTRATQATNIASKT